MYGGEYDLQKKIDFVLDFNSATFDQSRSKEIAGYLETSSIGIILTMERLILIVL